MPITRKNPDDPDSPFLTAEAIGKGVRFRDRFPIADFSKVTMVEVDDEGNKRVISTTEKIAISSDIVDELRKTGPDWIDSAEKILRAGLQERKQEAA